MTTEWDSLAPEAFISRWTGHTKNQLFRFLEWQEGARLGTPAAVALINAEHPRWLWDRTTGLLLEVYTAHPVLAGLLHDLHTGKEAMRDGGEAYLEAGLGFWVSSVSQGRTVHVPPGLKLTAQERMAFKQYTFKAWS